MNEVARERKGEKREEKEEVRSGGTLGV